MKIHTGRFGDIEIEEKKIIHFPHGILGFPEIKRYIVLDHPGKPDIPFKWLQAVDSPDIAFLITDPRLFCPEYNPLIDESDMRELDITKPEDLAIIVIVTVPHEDPEKITANFMGPILINLKGRKAKQLVLTGKEYPVQYPLYKNIPVYSP